MRISMALDHDEGIAYAIEGLCAVAAVRGDVEVAATLAGAAEMTRQRITMFDAAAVRLSPAIPRRGDDTGERVGGVGGDGPRARDVGDAEAAQFALANVESTAPDDRGAQIGRA